MYANAVCELSHLEVFLKYMGLNLYFNFFFSLILHPEIKADFLAVM